MKKQNNGKFAFFNKKWLYRAIALVCALLVLVPAAGVFARYIMTVTDEAEVQAALFVVDGEYVEEVPSGGAAPRIEVSGWRNGGIELTLYNHKDGKISAVDMSYTCEVSGGWTASEPVTLPKDNEGSATIRLSPPETGAAEGDEISFTLKTSPYALTMQATFVLTDSDKPEWIIEDKGAYTLLTIHTNDYDGDITVNYNSNIFAPDTTNKLMQSWTRATDGNGSGSFTAERFITYKLRLFEEIPGDYQYAAGDNTGNTITVTPTQTP